MHFKQSDVLLSNMRAGDSHPGEGETAAHAVPPLGLELGITLGTIGSSQVKATFRTEVDDLAGGKIASAPATLTGWGLLCILH